jgi:hypothetical protein
VWTRRQLLGAAAGLAVAACGRGGAPARVTSDVAALPGQLRALEAALRGHGYPVDQVLRPPRAPGEVAALAAGRGFEVPAELIRLWEWHDGQRAGFPLLRDHALLPFDGAIDAAAEVRDALEPVKTGVALVPFAALDGAWYCLPVAPFSALQHLERPVIAVFEGVTAMFASLGHLIETQIAWIEDGVARPGGHDAAREHRAWRRGNPGLPRELI